MRQLSRWTTITLFVVAAGVAVSIGLVLFYVLSAPTLRQNALLRQNDRAATIQRDLDAYLLVSQQIAQTMAAQVGPIRADRAAVETLLLRALEAAPQETVYGIGAWYEPFTFAADEPLFGPYVRRAALDDPTPTLTYEWTDPAYDFPTQPWYVAGRTSGGETVFLEPYFDTDLVYMSIVQPFSGTESAFGGVVTVDLVLPQLQALVAGVNTNPDEAIYVLTAEGRVFAHPDRALLLEYVRAQGREPQSLLDITSADLAAFAANGPEGRYHTIELDETITSTLETSGWTVIVAAPETALYDQVYRLRTFIGTGLVLLWAGVGLVLAALYRVRSRFAQAQVSLKQSEQRYSELFNSAPYPILIVAEDTGEMLLANDAALAFYGLARARLGEKRLASILAAPQPDQTIPLAYRAHEPFEDEHRRGDGKIAHVIVRCEPCEVLGRSALQCYILDSSDQKAVEAVVQEQQELIRSQERALARAATPLIPLSDNVLAMPLVGSLDEERTRQAIALLADGVEGGRARVVLIDVTGVPQIDAAVANTLIEAVQIVALLGARAIITGIHPEVAQSLVSLGIDTSALTTYSTLQDGIRATILSAKRH